MSNWCQKNLKMIEVLYYLPHISFLNMKSVSVIFRRLLYAA